MPKRRSTIAGAAVLGAIWLAPAASAQLSLNMTAWMHRIDSGKFSGGTGGRGAAGGRWLDGKAHRRSGPRWNAAEFPR